MFVNNHTSVWGSWYDKDNQRWGYGCCHSLISGSYCTGEAGKAATVASSAQALLSSAPEEEPEEIKSLVEMHREKLAKAADAKAKGEEEEDAGRRDKGKGKESAFARHGDDDDDVALDKARLKAAIAAERKRKALGEEEAWEASKKAKQDVTKEELEAYRLSRQTFDDPMANYKDPEE